MDGLTSPTADRCSVTRNMDSSPSGKWVRVEAGDQVVKGGTTEVADADALQATQQQLAALEAKLAKEEVARVEAERRAASVADELSELQRTVVVPAKTGLAAKAPPLVMSPPMGRLAPPPFRASMQAAAATTGPLPPATDLLARTEEDEGEEEEEEELETLRRGTSEDWSHRVSDAGVRTYQFNGSKLLGIKFITEGDGRIIVAGIAAGGVASTVLPKLRVGMRLRVVGTTDVRSYTKFSDVMALIKREQSSGALVLEFEPPDMNIVRHYGWMYKKGTTTRHNWTRRWFELNGQSLVWHKAQRGPGRDEEIRGEIDLGECSHVSKSDAASAQDLEFEITGPDRNFRFRCDSEKSYSSWYRAVSAAIQCLVLRASDLDALEGYAHSSDDASLAGRGCREGWLMKKGEKRHNWYARRTAQKHDA